MNEKDLEKVQMYFEAALAVPEDKREDFLAELCVRETSLCHEIKALLKADSQSKIWDSDELFDITREQPNTFHSGDEIGPYSIVEQIGEGGMGVIYKAHDKKLQRHVALKFLPVSMNSDAHTRQRFLAEARAASQLDHPNICVIHDVSETPDGQLFITMPCYEGETLAKRISRGSIPQMEAIDITIQVAQGLACAHTHNIVHRDIKPSNIMLTQNGGAKVLDFGIAKVENIHLTQTGLSIGTLAYMSPEQLRGEPVDARTDIWALGVVLFEVLSGKQAFPAKALPDILQSVLNDTDNTLEMFAKELPPAIYQVLQNAMARELQQRFVDMNNMLEALHEARTTLYNNHTNQDRSRINTNANNFTANNKKRRAYQWDEQVLEQVANILLPTLGPIAPVLVQRSAKTAADLHELSSQLAESLPDQNSRDLFNKQMEMQIAAFTSPPAPRAIKTDGSLAGVDLSVTQLAEIEAALIEYLGPITQTLIRRHAVNASSLAQLFDTLAQHINDHQEQQLFMQKMATHFEVDK
jgi:serine/threonine-protein kinase